MARSAAQKEPLLTNAADIEASLAAKVKEREAAFSLLSVLGDRREALLVDGTDEEIHRHDEDMRAAQLRYDRCAAIEEKLRADLYDAEKREKEADSRAFYERFGPEYAAFCRGYRTRYIARRLEQAKDVAEAKWFESVSKLVNANLPSGCEPLPPIEPYRRPDVGAGFGNIKSGPFYERLEIPPPFDSDDRLLDPTTLMRPFPRVPVLPRAAASSAPPAAPASAQPVPGTGSRFFTLPRSGPEPVPVGDFRPTRQYVPIGQPEGQRADDTAAEMQRDHAERHDLPVRE